MLDAGECKVLVQEKLVAGLKSYASLRLLTQVASWAGTVYVVRRLDSHALGQYGVALVVFNYLSMTYDGTLVEALVQRPPGTLAERRALFTVLVGIGLALAGATAGASGLIAGLVDDRSIAPMVAAVALALVLMSLCVLPHARLAREMDFRRLATIGAIQAISVTLATVLLAWSGAGAWALIAGLVVGAAVRLLMLNATTWGMTLPTLRVSPAFSYLKFGGTLFVDNILWRWYTSLDTFLLGRWTGTTSLGFYSLAQQVAELPLEKISTVVNDVSLPAYVHLSGDRSAAARLLLETIRTHATLGFPVFWGLAVIAPYLVPTLFGIKWTLAIFPLVALATVAPLRLIGSIETPAMTGLGCPEVLVKTKLVIAPCMTLALVVGCYLGGINGAALAWLMAFPVCYGAAFRFVIRAAGTSYREVLRAIGGPAAAAASMVALVLLWSRVAARMGAVPLFILVTGIALGMLSYAAALWVIDPETFRLAHIRVGRFLGLRQPT